MRGPSPRSAVRRDDGKCAPLRRHRWLRPGPSCLMCGDLSLERVLERTNDANLDDPADERVAVVGDVHDLVAFGAARDAARAGFALPLDEHPLRRADELGEMVSEERLGK